MSGQLRSSQVAHSRRVPRALDSEIKGAKYSLYTDEWLARPDELGVTGEAVVQPFACNGDRFAAADLHKRYDSLAFTRLSFISQAVAAGWHKKTAAQIKELGDRVGRDRILIVHGTKDRLIAFSHAETLLAELGGEAGGVTQRFIEGQAHVIPGEMRPEFVGWIEDMVAKTEGMSLS